MFWGHKINFPKIEGKNLQIESARNSKWSFQLWDMVWLSSWNEAKRRIPIPSKKKKKELFRNSWRKCKSPVWEKKPSWLQASPHPMAEDGAALTKVEGKKTAVETITPSQDSVQRQRQRTVTWKCLGNTHEPFLKKWLKWNYQSEGQQNKRLLVNTEYSEILN